MRYHSVNHVGIDQRAITGNTQQRVCTIGKTGLIEPVYKISFATGITGDAFRFADFDNRSVFGCVSRCNDDFI